MGDSNLVIKNDSFIQSMHNDIQCIESIDPSDKETSRQYWFTANMLANIFDISLNTAKNHIDSLIEWGALTVVKNLTTVQTQNNAGAVNDTTLYDLEVFNKLAMDLRTPAARMVKDKFNDILVKVETTGSYNVQEQQTPSYIIEDKIRRATVWIEEQKYALQLEAEKERLALENKTLEAELTEVSEQRDKAIKTATEAIATKAYINDKRTASLMGKVSGQSKKITKLEGELDTANHQKALVESKLDAVLSNMYSVDGVYHYVENLFHTGYQPSTLRSKLRKELNRISYTFGEVPKVGVNRGNPEHNPPKYYTKRVVEQIIENGKNDPMYFKRLKG